MSEEDNIAVEASEPTEVEQPILEEVSGSEPHVEEVQPSEESQFNETELKAMEQGWVPPDKFQEEGKQSFSAEEFLRRGELFGKIDSMKSIHRQETYRLEKRIDELTKLMKDSRKQGYTQAVKDLEARRLEAVEIGDIDSFNDIDSEYQRLKQEIDKEESIQSFEPSPTQINEVVLSFAERNKDWFNDLTSDNQQMKNQAIEIEDSLLVTEPYLTDAQRLTKVEGKIKELYPSKFKVSKAKTISRVESSAPVRKSTSSRTSLTVNDLSDRQKGIMAEFLSLDPTATAEDYLENLEIVLKQKNLL